MGISLEIYHSVKCILTDPLTEVIRSEGSKSKVNLFTHSLKYVTGMLERSGKANVPISHCR